MSLYVNIYFGYGKAIAGRDFGINRRHTQTFADAIEKSFWTQIPQIPRILISHRARRVRRVNKMNEQLLDRSKAPHIL